ncbi:MAG: PfkB family carbohydrate kinase [Pygmaiobacter massiliensis]|nr:PfkB family carbohydrate kinase [Pygmaiobacter massiliensis]
MKVVAVGDNCVDVYYTSNRFYPTGNAVDFAVNLKKQGQDVALVSIQGNDVFGLAVRNLLEQYGIEITHYYPGEKQSAAAQMRLVNGDRVHEKFNGNVLADFTLNEERLAYVQQFDIVYSEKWSRIGRYAPQIKREDNIMIHDFSKRLEDPTNEQVLPYLDYAFFSYDGLDDHIREFLRTTQKKTWKGKGTVVAMLGADGSLAFDGTDFTYQPADRVQVVNTVGAGDSYVSGFTKGLCEGLSLAECMRRGKDIATGIIQIFEPY